MSDKVEVPDRPTLYSNFGTHIICLGASIYDKKMASTPMPKDDKDRHAHIDVALDSMEKAEAFYFAVHHLLQEVGVQHALKHVDPANLPQA